MIIRRTNGNSRAATADACFAAVERHHARQAAGPTPLPRSGTGPAEVHAEKDSAAGDIIYGARAIALFLFGDDGNRARRRVFNLWAHYSARKERAGFFKLKGALCLSKAQWRAFHGLG
jgi:hypothetical protein